MGRGLPSRGMYVRACVRAGTACCSLRVCVDCTLEEGRWVGLCPSRRNWMGALHVRANHCVTLQVGCPPATPLLTLTTTNQPTINQPTNQLPNHPTNYPTSHLLDPPTYQPTIHPYPKPHNKVLSWRPRHSVKMRMWPGVHTLGNWPVKQLTTNQPTSEPTPTHLPANHPHLTNQPILQNPLTQVLSG